MDASWFAGRLRELREAAGLSRQQIADKSGLKLNGIRDLEQGRRLPSWPTVLAISQALGVDCNAFTTPPAEAPPPTPGRPRKASGSPATARSPGKAGEGLAGKESKARERKKG
jgi:transcriptional regulator with XRE-family HTH domain